MPRPIKGTPEYEVWNKARSAKISASKMGNVPRDKISASKMGHTTSQATRDKISATLMGRKPTPERHARQLEGTQHFWENVTPEQQKKMRKGRTGQKNSEAWKHLMSEKFKGRIISPHVIAAAHTPEATAKRAVSLRASFAALPPDEQERRIERFIRSGGGKSRDTSLEVYVASLLDEMGFIYESQKHIGRYVVDFLIPDQSMVIEVNGCFWHCCEQCGIKEEYHPGKREHDRKRIEALETKGYTVCVLWEHDLEPYMKKVKK